MSTMHLLYVDDEAPFIDLFVTAVKDWNRANPDRTFECSTYQSGEEALQDLRARRFDGALFDLKLKGDTKESKLMGNALAETTIEELGMPVGILSGRPADVSEKIKEAPLVNTFQKEGGCGDRVMEWFGELHAMMETLRLARASIRKSAAEIFMLRIWPMWQTYAGLSSAGLPLERVITRQFAYHIAEKLGADTEENPGWHPHENYIHPALLEHRAHTGDIFKDEDGFWVVLTPQCDMATGKIEQALMAYCDPTILNDWEEKCASLAEKVAQNEQPSNSLRGYFGDRVNQNLKPSEHFLAPLNGLPLMVQFKKLKLVPLAELNSSLSDRVASVAPPFLANLTQRFAAYMARPGQPNIDIKHFAG